MIKDFLALVDLPQLRTEKHRTRSKNSREWPTFHLVSLLSQGFTCDQRRAINDEMGEVKYERIQKERESPYSILSLPRSRACEFLFLCQDLETLDRASIVHQRDGLSQSRRGGKTIPLLNLSAIYQTRVRFVRSRFSHSPLASESDEVIQYSLF